MTAKSKRNATNSTTFEPGSSFTVEERRVELASLRPHPSNTYSMDQESIDSLADNIKAIGLIQPLYVREVEDGGLQILSGHRRARALRQLAAEDERFRMVDVRVARGLSDADALLILHSANIFRPVSKEERVRQSEQLKAEVAELRAEHPEWHAVPTDDIIAGMLGMTTSTYKRQTRIAKKLIPELYEPYERNNLGTMTALELVKQEPEYQREFARVLEEKKPKDKREAAAVFEEFSATVAELMTELDRDLSRVETTLFKLRDTMRRRGQPTFTDLERLKTVRDKIDRIIDSKGV